MIFLSYILMAERSEILVSDYTINDSDFHELDHRCVCKDLISDSLTLIDKFNKRECSRAVTSIAL